MENKFDQSNKLIKPNILWICTDQQRTDTLGCYGNKIVSTPNIDKLAKTGVLFEKAYCQSPVCTPSRASFLTGRYPRTTRCRQNGQKIPADEKLVTKMFADDGYVCGLTGKLHIAPCHPSVCTNMEERTDDGYSDFSWSHAPGAIYSWAGDGYQKWLLEKNAEFKREAITNCRQVTFGMDPEMQHTTWCVNEAIEFIRTNTNKQNPWLSSINIVAPHHPFDPPREYLEKYMDILDEVPMPDYREGELNNKPVYQRLDHEKAYNANVNFCFDSMSEYEHKLTRAACWAMVEHIDTQVGRLLDVLEETGQMDNTLIIFMSDHGEMLGDHGIYWKGPYFYEELTKVPLIISWPGVIKGNKRSSALVELVDIAPTLLDAAGIPIYEGIQGKSLWQMLLGNGPIDRHKEAVYCEYYNSQPWHRNPTPECTMVFDGQYKLIRDHSTGQGELYDLASDPAEVVNLYTDKQWIEVRVRMLEKLTDVMAWTMDPLPQRAAEF